MHYFFEYTRCICVSLEFCAFYWFKINVGRQLMIFMMVYPQYLFFTSNKVCTPVCICRKFEH